MSQVARFLWLCGLSELHSLNNVLKQVTGIFESSAEVMISVCGESTTERQVFYCGDAYATVVSVDSRKGGTVTIPFTLEPQTSLEKQRCAEAGLRRQMRLQVVCAFCRALSLCLKNVALANSRAVFLKRYAAHTIGIQTMHSCCKV